MRLLCTEALFCYQSAEKFSYRLELGSLQAETHLAMFVMGEESEVDPAVIHLDEKTSTGHSGTRVLDVLGMQADHLNLSCSRT